MSTIENGLLTMSSVSQVEKFSPESDGGCPRKWWLRYRLNWPEPASKAQERGVNFHKQCERYLRDGVDSFDRWGRPCIEYLPVPGGDLLVEHGFHDKSKESGDQFFFPPEESLLRCADVPFIGFVDLVNTRGCTPDENKVLVRDPDGTVEVLDHKTTSNLKYVKGPEQLRKAPQMLGYGSWVLEKLPATRFIRLSHVVTRLDQKQAPASVKSTVLVSADEVRNEWGGRITETVQQMKGVAALTEEDEVPYNLSACESYGGCAYRGKCRAFNNQSARAKLTTSLQRGSNMSLFNKAKTAASGAASGTAAAAAAAGAIPPPPPSNGAAHPPPAAMSAARPPAAPSLQQFKNPYSSPHPVTQAVGQPGITTADKAEQTKVYTLPSGARAIFLTATAIGGATKYSFIPVDANNAPNGTPELLDAQIPIVLWAPPAAGASSPPAPAAAAVPPPPPAVAGAAPAAPKRSKKTAIVDVPPPGAVPAGTTIPPTSMEVARATATNAQATTDKNPGLTGNWLLINCAPDFGVERLEPWILQIADELAHKNNVFDIRFAPDEKHPLAFARWKGALAAAIRAEPPTGVFAVNTGDEFVDIAIMALTPHFGRQIIRPRR